MDSEGCGCDEHFLLGTLTIRVTHRKSGAPAKGVRLCIGVTEDEALRFSCKARRAVTGPDGTCELEFPIGKAVVALPSKQHEIAWVSLDRCTKVELEV